MDTHGHVSGVAQSVVLEIVGFFPWPEIKEQTMAGNIPTKGWDWAQHAYAPPGKHCDGCLGTTRVRWCAVPIIWTHHMGPQRPAPSNRWVHLCDYCTWPDGGLLTNAACLDGLAVVILSSLRDRKIIVIPLNRWQQ